MATTDPNAKGLDASALASSEAQGLGVRWSRLQIGAVATCFILNMLDGMDILMMSYLAQSIATEWSVGAAALGVVFSAAIFGMMIGALALAPFADHLGRRPVILGAVALMGERDKNTDEIYISYSSPKTQSRVYSYNLSTKKKN